MHFFNPVPASALVEVVVGETTDPHVVDRRDRLGRGCWARQSVVVRDSPGFATSRLGVLLGLEAIRMLEEGVADAGVHRPGDGARLPPPDGPAALDRPGRPRRPAGHRRAPRRDAG